MSFLDYFGPGVAIAALGLVLVVVLGALYLIFLTVPALTGANVKLECPHCGAETPAHPASCRKCGRSFRDVAGDGTKPLISEWADTPRKPDAS